MKKLYELLNQNEVKGMFGVEIECEGVNLPFPPPVRWRGENDGSLRGVFPTTKCEYVFKDPVSYALAVKNIENLNNSFERNRSVLNFSFRTSTHVHINVQDLTWDEYLAFIYTALLMENVLSRFCGEERENNRFCLRLQDAESFSNNLDRLFGGKVGDLFDISNEDLRYSFINLAATPKYGSLEFRGMRGTTDVEVLKVWLKVLHNMKIFAKRIGSPCDVHDFLVEKHPSDFAKAVLRDVFEQLDFPELSKEIQRSFSLSLSLPYIYRRSNPIQEILL